MHRASIAAAPHDTRLIDALMTPVAFDHPVESLKLVETHISWLILTDSHAYKIKKPITLDFLDFGDLERRKFFCEEEIRLNQPFAPDIYLDVVAVYLEDGQPRFGDGGEAVEYAVRMRRFDDEMRLDVQLERGELSVEDMKELGRNIAERHSVAERVDKGQRDRVVTLAKEFIWDNFSALEGFGNESDLQTLRDWTEKELRAVEELLWKRFDDGYVRDCHGDLHLGNLVRLPSGITTFDCIEFSTDLRHIDVTADIAFLVMDLVEKKRHDLGAHFLNRYLERTGDYGSVRLLSLFFVYRCLVRAKVAAILSQERDDDDEREADLREVRRYCDMALRQIADRAPILIVMSGLSGSGKTRLSGRLMAAMPAIRMRSDVERKRMFGMSEDERSDSDIDSGIYAKDASQRVYEYLCETAGRILTSGHHAILDAAFLHEPERARAIAAARDSKATCVLISVDAPVDVLRERVQKRSRKADDASEARLDVHEHQLATAAPMTAAEREIAILCDTSREIDVDKLAARLKKRGRIGR
jgi:aminoglycoside phosphotransferase family enzyme/predicted kinase